MADMSHGEGSPCLVAAWAESAPERAAIRTPNDAITYSAWHARVRVAEQRLRAAGLEAGSRLVLSQPNGVDLLTLIVAAFRIGAIVCPLDPAFPAEYRNGLQERLGYTLAISAGDWGNLRRGGQGRPQEGIGADLGGALWHLDVPGTIVFTSGSTGNPKAAVLSLRNHVEAARLSNGNIPFGEHDAWLLSLPMHHVAGFGVLFRCLLAGATIAIPETGKELAASVEALGVTHVSLVARQLARWLDAGIAASRLKAILLGGSAIPAPLLDRAVAAGLPVHASYGMTETASQIASTPPGATRAQLATSGRPLAPNTVRIGAGGLIEVNGPSRFLGYWEEGSVRAPFGDDGWFAASDFGFLDDEGFLHVTGRMDNVFVAGGENVQPESIERVICDIPGVLQAIVVPVPHPEFGATPVAFVACEGILDELGLRSNLVEKLPRFQVPRYVFPWPAELADRGMKVSRARFAELAERLVGD